MCRRWGVCSHVCNGHVEDGFWVDECLWKHFPTQVWASHGDLKWRFVAHYTNAYTEATFFYTPRAIFACNGKGQLLFSDDDYEKTAFSEEDLGPSQKELFEKRQNGPKYNKLNRHKANPKYSQLKMVQKIYSSIIMFPDGSLE
jgi:hypothetical protein